MNSAFNPFFYLTFITFRFRGLSHPSDSDDEGPKRVVRAQKDKTYSELKEKIRQARNARNIKDMSKLLTCFESLGKSYVFNILEFKLGLHFYVW